MSRTILLGIIDFRAKAQSVVNDARERRNLGLKAAASAQKNINEGA